MFAHPNVRMRVAIGGQLLVQFIAKINEKLIAASGFLLFLATKSHNTMFYRCIFFACFMRKRRL
jgi:hypothetical protein